MPVLVVLILFWSVIQVLNNIEASLNDIWQIRKPRSPIRKYSDYLAIMILSPFAIGLSGSFMVKIQTTADEFEFLKPLIVTLMKSVPYVLHVDSLYHGIYCDAQYQGEI